MATKDVEAFFVTENISALFDEELTEKETKKAIDLLLSNDEAQKLWRDACVTSDISNGCPPSLQNDTLLTKVCAQLSLEHTQNKEQHTLLKWKLYNFFFHPQVRWKVTTGLVFTFLLAALLVWQPWQQMGKESINNFYTSIDSPLNTISLQKDQHNPDQEMGIRYLQQHQEAILSGL